MPKGNFIGHKGSSTWQPFIYENIPIICTSCGKVGHKATGCPDASSSVPVVEVGAFADTSAVVDQTVGTSASARAQPKKKKSDDGPKASSAAASDQDADRSSDKREVIKGAAASSSGQKPPDAANAEAAKSHGWTYVSRKSKSRKVGTPIGPAFLSINPHPGFESLAQENEELRLECPTSDGIPDSVRLIAENSAKTLSNAEVNAAEVKRPIKSILKRAAGPSSHDPQ